MTFAKVPPVSHETVIVDHPSHRHHHHGAMSEERQPAEPAARPACNAFGCFVLVESMLVRLPAAVLEPIGALSPGVGKALLAADIEPAIPPPRLQA
jgi:hypothetical protein